MPIYIARWDEVAEPDGGTSWKPLGVGDSPFAAIDLTPPGQVPWRCLFRTPTVLADTPGRRRLATGHGEQLSPALRNNLGNDLGITLEDRPSLAEILAHILLDHAREDGTRWRSLKPERDGALRINLGGRVWEMLPIRGGASIADDFNRADDTNISTGAPFSWTEVAGAWDISGNTLRSVNALGRARAESDLASADHYSQIDCTVNTSQRAGLAVRFDPAADTCYEFVTRNNGASTRRLYKVTAGTLVQLVNDTTTPLPSGVVTLKCEINGSTLKGFEAGTEMLSITDTAITGNTRTGVATDGGATTLVFDNFSAADLGAGGDQTVTPGTIANGNILYAPTVTQAVTPGIISNAPSLYEPRLDLSVALGLINNSNTVLAPVVTVPQTVSLGLITNAPVLYEPRVDQAVVVGAITNTPTLFAPTVIQSVAIGIISNGSVVYAPFVDDGGIRLVSVDIVSHGHHVYAPVLTKFWVRETLSPRRTRPGTTRIHGSSRGRDPGIDTGR